MNYNRKILTNLNLLFYFIAAVFISIISACNPSESVERNIAFEDNWENVNSENLVLRKEFNIEKQSDKLYFIEFESADNLSVQLNRKLLRGRKVNGKSTIFELTDYMKNLNTIEVHHDRTMLGYNKGNQDLNIKLHCLNKLYIPEISLESKFSTNSDNSLRVEVRVKNVFDLEKQGLLSYNIYNGKNQKIMSKETPVFIPGNTENLYRQELNIASKKIENQKIKVDCRLYADEILFDSDSEVFEIKSESLLSIN